MVAGLIDVSKWYAKLQEENDCLIELWGLKCNRKLFSDHIERMKVYKLNESGWTVKDEEQWAKKLREAQAAKGFEHVYASYNRHVIVLCSSFIQRIIFEYVEETLNKRPEKMLSYLEAGNEKSKAKIGLSEILESDSKEELIQKLIRRSAANITNGRFCKVLTRIEKIGGIKIPAEVADIVELRNSIVHDEKIIDIGLTTTQQAIYTVFNLLKLIQENGKKDHV